MERVMRAKLRIQSVQATEYSEQLKFAAQYSNTPEDNSFSEATPTADATLQITNKALWGKFKPGQAFYVDFIPVE